MLFLFEFIEFTNNLKSIIYEFYKFKCNGLIEMQRH
jgi:hypothetical protein